MNNPKSTHIMNASTNLVGFTFIVLTSIKAFRLDEGIFVDKITALSVVGFMFSTLFSFFSMRTRDKKKSDRYEAFADYVFFGSLLMMLVVCILLTIYYK